MKKLLSVKFLFFVIVLTLASSTTNSNAQIRYTETETIDSVTIMYRWQRSHIFKKDSRTILNLRLTNNNDYPVEITLSVGFYDSGVIVYSSDEHVKCIMPGKTKRGGRKGLRFISEELSLEEIEADIFDWSFKRFEVKETDECP